MSVRCVVTLVQAVSRWAIPRISSNRSILDAWMNQLLCVLGFLLVSVAAVFPTKFAGRTVRCPAAAPRCRQ